MDKIKLAKNICGGIVSLGSTFIVSDAIGTLVRPKSGLVRSICMSVAAVAMADLLADKLADHILNQIDEFIKEFQKKEVTTDV